MWATLENYGKTTLARATRVVRASMRFANAVRRWSAAPVRRWSALKLPPGGLQRPAPAPAPDAPAPAPVDEAAAPRQFKPRRTARQTELLRRETMQNIVAAREPSGIRTTFATAFKTPAVRRHPSEISTRRTPAAGPRPTLDSTATKELSKTAVFVSSRARSAPAGAAARRVRRARHGGRRF